jgi:hypothetical protein
VRNHWAGGISAWALGLTAACASPGSPVPVAGDTRILAGEWDGTYMSRETGRSGSIVFRLKAGTDSAFGDVVMVPATADLPEARVNAPAPDPLRRMPRVLTISFVQCGDGEVTGRLDPYEDPDTHERVVTTFQGRLSGNRFEGTFVSVIGTSGYRVAGTWWAERKSS